MAETKTETVASLKLRELLKKKVVTQRVLSEVLGITQQAISSWSSGKARPTLENMLQLERLYGVRVSEWAEPPTGAAPEQGSAPFRGDRVA